MQLQALSLSSCAIDRIPASVANLTVLTSITLSNCKLTHLELDVFTSNLKLDSIDLHANRIQLITCKVQSGLSLSRVKLLNLSQNRLEKIQLAAFELFPNLQILDLESNQLKTLEPTPLPVLKSLISLTLNENSLGDSEIRHLTLPTLECLNMVSNRLTSIPNHFRSLQMLMLQNNQIKLVDLQLLDVLQNLKYISLARNGIQIITSTKPVYLPILDSFFLEKNDLRSIETHGWQFPSLTYMNVDDNQITIVPDLFKTFPQLRFLSVEQNPLQCAPLRGLRDKILSGFLMVNLAVNGESCTGSSQMALNDVAHVCCNYAKSIPGP